MTLEAALEEKIASTVLFELSDQRNSGFQLKGTENTPNPISMRSSKLNLITITSEVCLGDRKGYAKIQWVPNAPTIFTEDMYVDKSGNVHSKGRTKQEGWELQLGLKSLGYDLKKEYANARDMKVGFEFGFLNMDKYGNDPTLLTYIMNHHCYEGRPNAKFDTKKHSGLFKFRLVQEEKNATKLLATIDVELEASEYVSSLRTKKGKDFTYTEANEAKIDATLRICNLNPGCQPEEYSRKHLLLKQYADTNPVQFMAFIAEAFNNMRVEIGKAISYKVLEIAKKEKEVKFCTEDADKKVVKTTIFHYNSEETADQIEELSIHFINDSGIVDYKNMLMQMTLAFSKN